MNERFHMLTSMGVPRRMAERVAGQRGAVGRIEFRAAADNTAELLIYEQIGYDWWTDGGMTATRFAEELKAVAGVDALTVRINSPGGDVWDGMSIYNQLVAFGPRVNVMIDGMAASIASLVAMAGDHIQASEVSQMMIHDAWTGLYGNEQELRDMADVLAKIDQQIAETFATRSGRPAAEFRDLMDNDTYLTAQEAESLGLVDEIINARKTGDNATTDHTTSRLKARKRQISLLAAASGI